MVKASAESLSRVLRYGEKRLSNMFKSVPVVNKVSVHLGVRDASMRSFMAAHTSQADIFDLAPVLGKTAQVPSRIIATLSELTQFWARKPNPTQLSRQKITFL